jgi:hypothetical protein
VRSPAETSATSTSATVTAPRGGSNARGMLFWWQVVRLLLLLSALRALRCSLHGSIDVASTTDSCYTQFTRAMFIQNYSSMLLLQKNRLLLICFWMDDLGDLF